MHSVWPSGSACPVLSFPILIRPNNCCSDCFPLCTLGTGRGSVLSQGFVCRLISIKRRNLGKTHCVRICSGVDEQNNGNHATPNRFLLLCNFLFCFTCSFTLLHHPRYVTDSHPFFVCIARIACHVFTTFHFKCDTFAESLSIGNLVMKDHDNESCVPSVPSVGSSASASCRQWKPGK